MEVSSLELTFTTHEGGREVELVPGGAGLAVDDENKHDFIQKMALRRLLQGMSFEELQMIDIYLAHTARGLLRLFSY